MRTPYKLADEAAARITMRLRQEFRHNRLALFDEMRILDTRKHIKKLYKNAYDIIGNEFLRILPTLTKELQEEALAAGYDGEVRKLDASWLKKFFSSYDPVTMYVFLREMDRKESRLFEALVSNPKDWPQCYKTAENLLVRQARQYADNLEDEVTKIVYKDAGVKKVKWVAELDAKTCTVCSEMDGTVYSLSDVPDKQHYNCRCYIVPVK